MAMTTKDMLRNSDALTGVARRDAERREKEMLIAIEADRDLEKALEEEIEKSLKAKSKRKPSVKKNKK